jgi:hypothetical protein
VSARRGHPTRSLIDDFLPTWDEAERHDTLVAASPARVEQALRELSARDLPLTRLLFAVRGALSPDKPDPGVPFLESLRKAGFITLAEAPGRELVLGVAGRPWALRADSLDPIESPGDFHAYARPNAVRAAMNFALQREGECTRLVTETRVQATDSAAQRTFRRYWRLVMPGSALIRREALRAVRARAETGVPPAG